LSKKIEKNFKNFFFGAKIFYQQNPPSDESHILLEKNPENRPVFSLVTVDFPLNIPLIMTDFQLFLRISQNGIRLFRLSQSLLLIPQYFYTLFWDTLYNYTYVHIGENRVITLSGSDQSP